MKNFITTLSVLIMLLSFALFIDSAEAENPCAMNPCTTNPFATKPAVVNKPIRRGAMTDMNEVKALGEKLWSDSNLGKSGLSCNSCHPGGRALTNDRFPKFVLMAGDILTLDQMINFCMKNPMKARPLKWKSAKMTALAYYASTHSNPANMINPFQKNPFQKNPCGANPCGANPCGMNPWGVNPCGINPCGTSPSSSNPCSANPCAGK